MKNNLEIWAIADDRIGNVNQVIGVCEAIGMPFVVKTIRYNKLARLPNVFKGRSLFGIREDTAKEIYPPWPDLVISAGRKSAPVSLYIKKLSPKTKIVHIMRPQCCNNDFDLIILPEHDLHKSSKNIAKNIMLTPGAPNRVTQNILIKERLKWESKFSNLPNPRIAVIIGGNSKHGKFTARVAADFTTKLNSLVNNVKGSLLITTSRRTPLEAIEKLKKELQNPKYFYDFRDGGENPYFGLLACADIIITTGDSISMCSESCTTGKPVYIYTHEDFVPKKHMQFINNLTNKGYARKLEGNLENFVSKPCLQDSKNIAEKIKKELY